MADLEHRIREMREGSARPRRLAAPVAARAGARDPSPAVARAAASAEAAIPRLDASIGGRGPASPSFLDVRTPGLGPRPEAELAGVRAELTAVQAEITTIQASLDVAQRQLAQSLAAADAARIRLTSARSRAAASRQKTGLLGGLLTFGAFAAAPFTAGGSLLAIGGNAVGFATLKSVMDQDGEIRRIEIEVGEAERRLAGARAERERLGRRRGELDRRAADLAARDATLGEEVHHALAADPTEAAAHLHAAQREARGLLVEARELLADYQRLAARAVELGVSVGALAAELAAQAARAEAYVAVVEAQVQRMALALALAVVSAGSAAGVIDDAAAKALEGAVSAAKFFALPEAERVPWLAARLTAALLPGDAPLAARIASGAVRALLGPAEGGAQKLEALLAGAAWGAAERAWLAQLAELSGGVSLAPLVEALIGLTGAQRTIALSLFQALAPAIEA